MEIDGWYMLFYDKFADTHAFNNKLTVNKTMNGLFESDFIQLNDNDAIEEFNKFGETYTITENLDRNLYQIIMFVSDKHPIEKYTVVGVNGNLLKKYIVDKKEIPNRDFLISVCRFHILYHKGSYGGIHDSQNEMTLIKKTIDDIIKSVLEKTGDIIDPMIESPKFLNINLYPYQKRSINWMLQREKDYKSISFNLNDEISLGDVLYDAFTQNFMLEDEKKKLQFKGGALIDEVGLGKTIQMTTLSLLNPSTDLKYIRPGSNKLYSRATLIMCPNQLCGQWKRELEDKIKSDYNVSIVPLLTKVHFDKYTYQDVLDADFVILSYSFLDNRAFLDSWLSAVSKNKQYHKSSPSVFDRATVNRYLDTLGSGITKNPSILAKTNPQLLAIHWHRIIVDEFHENHTVDKYKHIVNILPLFQATYKWAVTGTPFDKNPNCLYNMIDYCTGYPSILTSNKILLNQNIKNYILNSFFRRNTKKSVTQEYKLPPIKEEIVWLTFTPTERMMYNAYLANPNNDKFSKFLRQLCCHPKISEETKHSLSNCKTLEDIEKTMIKHYAQSAKLSENKVNNGKTRIKVMEARIKKYERKRQKRILKTMGYRAIREKTDNEETELIAGEDGENLDMSLFNIDDSDSDDSDDDSDDNRETIIVNDENQTRIMKIIGKKWDNNRLTLDNMYETLANCKKRLDELTKDYEGKKTTLEFYNNVMERIRKTVEKKENIEDEDSDSDCDSDDDEDEVCGICLGEIPENNIGVTKCGHLFCYQCIKTIINQKQQCPYCRKGVKDSELYIISYEKNKKVDQESKELKDKIALINKVGTKLANLIYYLKKTNQHTIIFSQWDDLLHKVGEILDSHGIKNAFCRGNVWQRDKAIRTFNSEDDVKVIMLSSESAASGTNLTKASQVILLDPVYGTYEFRKNTEWQAVGRAHRMGQTKEVKVVRFIVKNTVEEEIYKMNQADDAKYKVDIKILESNDDSLTLSKEMIDEISESAEKAKKKSKEKTKKTLLVKGKGKKQDTDAK
ncbi:DEAD/SNF2-like helicase [Catovirus CTV1]|uniref:DEAD/SNF2-like helicase n=1 Tax=Catovirus CTV1 TaxID=1977631 RepID=A0A1V0SBB0_9VIRU|nr:DEAD/SNF2-like helicase [Catovirus CTV1]